MNVNSLSITNASFSTKPQYDLASQNKPLETTEESSLTSDKESQSPKTEESSHQKLADQRELQLLRARDREVKAHELAHASVGGRYVTSGASFNYEKGPDGKMYAVSGEVKIDTAEVPGDPQATLNKALVVARAAMAPANPSAQDRRVAAQAAVLVQQARLAISVEVRAAGEQQENGSKLDIFA